MRKILLIIALVTAIATMAQRDTTLMSHRPDGRYQSTYAVLHHMLEQTTPQWAYHKGMTKRQYIRWQKGLTSAMRGLMKWPKRVSQPAPCMVKSTQMDGYVQEEWESYPLPDVVVPFLVLRPNQSVLQKRPALLCIPGSGQPMRHLAKGMALDYVKEGWIAVCVDNAAAGDQGDLETKMDTYNEPDYVLASRVLLELGWNWLGYTSFLNQNVLDWMKTAPGIDSKRIVISGFSLGTEPMMVLGVMNPDVYGFVYNDFLCQTQERALSLTATDKQGYRHFPNSIRHLIPGYWTQFNFPDVCCALSPRPIIFTEGGLDRDFALVRDAYRTSGAAGKAEFIHYARYQDPSARSGLLSLPEGLTLPEYLPLVNVDAGHHYFKREYVLPWLRKILK